MRSSSERVREIAALRAGIFKTMEPYFTGAAAWPAADELTGADGLALLTGAWKERERVLKTEPAASAWSAAIKPLLEFFKEPHYEERFEAYSDSCFSEAEIKREGIKFNPNEYPDVIWGGYSNNTQAVHYCRLSPQGNRVHGVTPGGATFALRESSKIVWIDPADDGQDGWSPDAGRDRRINFALLLYYTKQRLTPAYPYFEPELYPRRTWAQALELLETRARDSARASRVGAIVYDIGPTTGNLRGVRSKGAANASLLERIRVIQKPSKDDPARKIEHSISVQISTRGQLVFMGPNKYAGKDEAIAAALERFRAFDCVADKAIVLASMLLHGEEYAEISPGIMHAYFSRGQSKLSGPDRKKYQSIIRGLMEFRVILSDADSDVSFPVFQEVATIKTKTQSSTVLSFNPVVADFNNRAESARHLAWIDPAVLQIDTKHYEWAYAIAREANRLWNTNAKRNAKQGGTGPRYKLKEFLERAQVGIGVLIAEQGEPAAFRRIEEELEHLRETGVAPGIRLERDPSGLIDASKISIGPPPPHLAAEIGRLLPTASDRLKALPAPAEIPSA